MREKIKLMAGAKTEQKQPYQIKPIAADKLDDISVYYQFEIDQGFSRLAPGSSLASMVDYRQGQIKENKLRIAMAKINDRPVATAVVVLENGIMGKKIKPDQAWAAGTVVAAEMRNTGIGEKMTEIQDKMAKQAGKKFILTTITNDNYPSMRLYMKVGYKLNGLDLREDEINYTYEKSLTAGTTEQTDWRQKVIDGSLKIFSGKIDNAAPSEILIVPGDLKMIEAALNNGYQGHYLLRPQEFGESPPINQNFIVFARP